MANVITSLRIICSIIIIKMPIFSLAFYILFFLSGVTDMVDGAVARKTGTASEFGSKLDTFADFLFVVVCMIKLLPALIVPGWLWIWIGIIVIIKVVNIVSCFKVHKKFVAEHTIMNKITGLLLFVIPFTLTTIELKYSAAIVCGIATFAAIQEGHFIRNGRIVE